MSPRKRTDQSPKTKKPRAPRKKKAEQQPAENQETTTLQQAADQVLIDAKDRQEAARIEDAGKQVAKDLGAQPGMAEAKGHAATAEPPPSNGHAPEVSADPVHLPRRSRVDEHGQLIGAKPRKSGRRAVDINLGGDGHTWERVESADRQQIIFRFKDPASEEQLGLMQRFGFLYDAETKEAHRPNDATGRTYADKLAWYLKQAEREQQHEQVATR